MKRIESAALLVRSVAYGEADIIATFFTETDGKLSAIVRGARRSTKRFGGALEPIHELFIVLDDKGKELCVLKEARIVRPREGIVSDLDLMDAAGRALRWVRHLCPARTPEPSAWDSLRALLDVLDAQFPAAPAPRGLRARAPRRRRATRSTSSAASAAESPARKAARRSSTPPAEASSA